VSVSRRRTKWGLPGFDKTLAYVVEAESDSDWKAYGARAALFAGMPMNPQGRLFAEIQMNQNLLNVTFKKLGIVQADED